MPDRHDRLHLRDQFAVVPPVVQVPPVVRVVPPAQVAQVAQAVQLAPSRDHAAIHAPILEWSARDVPQKAALSANVQLVIARVRRVVQRATVRPVIVRVRRVVRMVIVDLVEVRVTHGRPVLDAAAHRGQANELVGTLASHRAE